MDEYGGYTAHPAADIFPLLEGKEFRDLVADIKANGLLEPIEILRGTDQILDGRNRARACVKAGVEINVNPVVLHGAYEDSPYRYVVSKNLHRRQLTNDQRAMIAAEAKGPIAEEKKRLADLARSRAQEKQTRGAGGRFTGPASGSPLNSGATRSEERNHHQGESAAQAAQAFDVSRYKVDQAVRIKEADPKLAEEVKAGRTTAAAAERQTAARPQRSPMEIHGKWVANNTDPEEFVGWLKANAPDYLEDLAVIIKEGE